ncbi:sensor histidine kinase [Mesonia aestuariivivens]|uniref:ATP-binding protein n=1 Tax=Mesonia aestuariivivens TaxID=2796128 RepID=A0ABS6W505_9FLAO|nr:ATP-binding protein [Mesonia aestuariivivens]MBW2962941.1 ATP-binding protein [Mesonia aestuariivivens]
MTNPNELHFKTNVQLKSIIGKDLINDDNIAILELVKNSFDADAKRVNVTYLNLKNNDDEITPSFSNKTSRLIIQDDGLGMDLEDIQDKWLNIAYSEKKSNKKQHNRRMAGAKGVGRFSCDRLGEYLNLYAKTKDDNKYLKLSIDWKLFEIEDEKKEIQSIPLKFQYLSKNDIENIGFKAFDNGVLLEVIKLRSSWAYPIKDKSGNTIKWDTEKFVDLKKYLEKLINPNQAFQNDDFGIYISTPEFIKENDLRNEYEKFIGKVENRIFDKLDFKSTSIETRTQDGGEIIYTELKDKGDTIFWLKEKNPYYPSIKNVKISIYYLNPYAKAFFTKQTGIQSVNYGSIFLFINGFRISPYGDVGNDWLGLDQRKAQKTRSFLGLRDIIGQIEILDELNDFQIISSREGIVRNDNYKDLTNSERNDSFYYKAHRRLERYVVEGLNWDSSIYDNKDPQFKEIEQKIISGKAKENELIFREDDQTKQRRTYGAIHSIISARVNDVIELYINENLITQKIEEERQKSEREFQQLIEDFDNKKIDSETLGRILQRKAEQNAELEKQLKEFAKYSTNEATTKAILELQNYKKTVEEQTMLIAKLQYELDDLKNQKQSAEKTAKEYKDKAEKAEVDLSIEKEKNLYLLATRRTLSPDADGLIHTIKINNIEIRDGIDNIIDDLTEDDFNINNLIERLGFLKLNAERSLKMAEFVTRSDLKEDIEKKDVDLVSYIQEYISLYGETFSDKMLFEFKVNNSYLNKNISVLNLSIILDNLISNSIKWGAENILIEFNNKSDKQLEMIFSDDGDGLSNKFLDKHKRIFELSVRDIPSNGMNGSGIGLFYTKNLLNDMNSEIDFIGNNLKLSGASFKLIFNTI